VTLRQQASRGQELEFEAFARARLPELLRLGVLLSGDSQQSQDLTQTALTKAFLHWRAVSTADNPDAYLSTIMVNTWRSWRRRPGFRRERPLTEPHEQGAASPFAVVDDRRDLVAALSDLPPRQRLAVVLRYCLDLPEREAAGILGCSGPTVRSQASRGLAKLRAHPALAAHPSDQQEQDVPS